MVGGNQIFDLTVDAQFSGSLICTISGGLAPQISLSRMKPSEKVRTFFLSRSGLSTLLSSLEKIEEMINNLDYQTKVKLTDKHDLALTLFNGFQYVCFTYATPRGNQYHFNTNLEEYHRLHNVLLGVRQLRDDKMEALKSSLSDRKLEAPNQTTLHEIHFSNEDGTDKDIVTHFDLEAGIRQITDKGLSVISTSKRKANIPTLAAVAMMFTTLLKKCEKENHLKVPVDAMIISAHIQQYYKLIGLSPYVSSDILTMSQFSLDARVPVDSAFANHDLLNRTLEEASYVSKDVYVPRQSQNGYLSKWGINSAINISY
mgnify:CR=1 FL=1